MSGSISTTGQQTGGATSAAAANTGSSSSGTGSASDALNGLSSNFSTFLQLLMTQLQNQDPTSPMDTSTFTTELVQFSGVEQQINTNSNLSTLIQLQQGSEMVQATGMVGRKVTATSSQLSLQGGNATSVGFTPVAAGQVGITVTNSTGSQIYSAKVDASAGANSWTWNGENSAGTQMPDGVYTVSVVGGNGDGTYSPLATTVTGVATGVTQSGTTVQLDIGSLPVNFSSITAVASGS